MGLLCFQCYLLSFFFSWSSLNVFLSPHFFVFCFHSSTYMESYAPASVSSFLTRTDVDGWFSSRGRSQELIAAQVMPQGRAPPYPHHLLLHPFWERINTDAAVTASLKVPGPAPWLDHGSKPSAGLQGMRKRKQVPKDHTAEPEKECMHLHVGRLASKGQTGGECKWNSRAHCMLSGCQHWSPCSSLRTKVCQGGWGRRHPVAASQLYHDIETNIKADWYSHPIHFSGWEK